MGGIKSAVTKLQIAVKASAIDVGFSDDKSRCVELMIIIKIDDFESKRAEQAK